MLFRQSTKLNIFKMQYLITYMYMYQILYFDMTILSMNLCILETVTQSVEIDDQIFIELQLLLYN